MLSNLDTGLWKRSLGAESASEEEAKSRQRLIVALDSMHENAVLLAGEIVRDHPDFTVHGAAHFDALWGLADQIAGPDFELTPNEAFVFGAATLLHDLGMASAAYIDGLVSIEEDPRWPDRVAFVLRQGLDRVPTAAEIESAGEEVKAAARRELLRQLHAERAEQLTTATWEGKGGTQLTLLEDDELRAAFGSTVGLVAHSHLWSPTATADRLGGKLGAPFGPATWTVRPQTIAYLLRLADASHLDAARAPQFLRALRKINSSSAPHWDFQEKMAKPYAQGDRFVFTSAPFGISEASAWWLCADMLKMVDREFQAVDSLLADHGEQRFAIRGVVGVNDFSRLAEHVPPQGWTPADAQVHVSDVVSLVERLGGRELYGADLDVPLRELLQNGSDAVRARRAIEDRPSDWGEVSVALEPPGEAGQRWLEVADQGVGMSRAVLTNHLLDFGRSFWESEHVLAELPGLLSTGFQPTGKFGIGFFSVFMWGDDVQVASRRHDARKDETHVLEFNAGLGGRPLLRPASTGEQMVEPGTRVRVLLDEKTLSALGIEGEGPIAPGLSKRCAWLAPTLDVTLQIRCSDEPAETPVVANDWLEMSMEELMARLRGPSVPRADALEEGADDTNTEEKEEAKELDTSSLQALDLFRNERLLMLADGTPVGRAFFEPTFGSEGVITVGGLRSGDLGFVSGVLLGRATTASRQAAVPVVPGEALTRWAEEQRTLVTPNVEGVNALVAAQLVRTCGADTGELPIARTGRGYLSRQEAVEWAASFDELLLTFDVPLPQYGPDKKVELFENAAEMGIGGGGLLRGAGWQLHPWPKVEASFADFPEALVAANTLAAALIEAISEGWGIPAERLLTQMEDFEERLIGTRDGSNVEESALLLGRAALA